MLKFVYTFFLGLLLAIFVGFGIATFYPAPKMPEYPHVLQKPLGPGESYSTEQKQADADYQKQSQGYGTMSAIYNRNVSIIALIAAVIFLIVSLGLHTRITILADGLLLGGTFTLIYSIGRSFASSDPKYSFVVITVGLAVTLIVGYIKFIRPLTQSKTKKKK